MVHSGDQYRKRRDAMNNNAPRETFTRAEIGERGGWRCGLCHDTIDPTWSQRDHRHPLAPSIDHIQPLALGGGHTRANVQITHMGCNLDKNTGRCELTLEEAARWREWFISYVTEQYPRDDYEWSWLPTPEKQVQRNRESLRPERYRETLARAVERYEAGRRRRESFGVALGADDLEPRA